MSNSFSWEHVHFRMPTRFSGKICLSVYLNVSQFKYLPPLPAQGLTLSQNCWQMPKLERAASQAAWVFKYNANKTSKELRGIYFLMFPQNIQFPGSPSKDLIIPVYPSRADSKIRFTSNSFFSPFQDRNV